MRIGIDLGGTKIEAIALDSQGRELMRRRVPTPAGNYGATLDALAGLIEGIERELGRRGSVGIGIPGALSPASGRVKNANSTCLIGERLDRDLAARLGRPVRLANDANCFALSEAMDGAGRGHQVVFGVILGTGVGGGIAADRRVLAGPNAIAGEWGHNPLPWPAESEQPGPDCYCGKRGCIETFVSGPGLLADYLREIQDREIQDSGGCGLASVEAVVAAAKAGDVAAEACLMRYEDRFARSLATVINILDPDVVVLGGGLSNLTRLYDGTRRRLPAYVFSDRVDTPILAPVHGDSSGVRGAAWLWAPGEAAFAREGRG